MKPVIALDNVTKVYESGAVQVEALRGVSLSIGRSEFVALVGASGSGKSTLMNILGCLDTPTRGAYYFEGQSIGKLGPAARARLRNQKLGFVFQGFNLLKRQTALENVALPLVYSGVSAARQRDRAMELLKLVGLADRAHHQPSQLSGGQQQRVAIARALANRPEVLLADEPTGNLDSVSGEKILVEFERLNRELGQTILLVTHDATVAARAARRVAVRDGLIASDDGSPDTIPLSSSAGLPVRRGVTVLS